MDPKDRITNDFSFHQVNEEQKERVAVMRTSLRQVAEQALKYVPPGREQSLVLTKLEEAMFWSSAGISRNPE